MENQKIEKLWAIISALSNEEQKEIAERVKNIKELSPRVKKMVGLFEKLNEEEKSEFFRNVKTTDEWTSEADSSAEVEWSGEQAPDTAPDGGANSEPSKQ